MTELITPQEAIVLSRHRPISDFKISQNIFAAVQNSKSDEFSDSTYRHLCALAAIYNAGRIQGIREERRKHRNK